jgi:glycosyltransferase involved in cell wall biosynthesis
MLTVVMPAYNEQDIIETSVREWHDEVVARIPGARLLVVDDCSRDRTGEILARLARELPALQAVRTPANCGHGPAVRFGLDLALTEWVFQTDSDRQHLPAEFWQLWNLRENADFVLGRRRSRADGSFRRFVTATLRLAVFLVFQTWIQDANCPFKLMRRGPLTTVLARIPKQVFIPMVMVSILARKFGFRVLEVEITHLPRKGGSQSLKGLLRWLRVGTLCFFQVLRLRLSLR